MIKKLLCSLFALALLVQPAFTAEYAEYVEPAEYAEAAEYAEPAEAAEHNEYNEEMDFNYQYISAVVEMLEDEYHFDVPYGKIWKSVAENYMSRQNTDLESGISAALAQLDDYSEYVPAAELEDTLNSIQGNYCGIGVRVTQQKGRIIVVGIIPKSPAEMSNIEIEDVIYMVNDENIEGQLLNDVIAKILGEEGTSVKVGFKRNGVPHDYDMVRAKLSNPECTFEVLPEGIGLFTSLSFNMQAIPVFEEGLKELDEKGITNVIIDLRNNGGGDINAVLALADMFLPSGEVAHIIGKNAENNMTFRSKNKDPKYKLAILVNEYSASASELFAGSAQDLGVATLVGVATYGKGTVQRYFPLSNGGAAKLTIAEYTTAKQRKVDYHGIDPDIFLRNKMKFVGNESMPLLNLDAVVEAGLQSEDIYAVEKRLWALGFLDVADEICDDTTIQALRHFQSYNRLPVTAVFDFETALALNAVDFNFDKLVDLQKEAAIKVFTEDSPSN